MKHKFEGDIDPIFGGNGPKPGERFEAEKENDVHPVHDIFPSHLVYEHGHDDQVRISLNRHPEKAGTKVPMQTLEGKEGEPNLLPLEGILQAQQKGIELGEQFKKAPAGSVFLGFTSNVSRTQEADYILGQELKVAARNMSNAAVFDGRRGELSSEEIAEQVDSSIDRVVIINSPQDATFGMRKWNLQELVGDMQKTGKTEVELFNDWLEDEEMQKRYGFTPKEIADEFKTWIKDQAERVRKLFPSRPVVITGIGHSFELDAAIYSLMGKEFSKETSAELGGMIGTMEGAEVILYPGDTSLDQHHRKEKGVHDYSIQYRGKVFSSTLD